MKTFKDLEFKQHPLGGKAEQAIMKFPDGSSISVITGDSVFYCTDDISYEMMSNRSGRGGVRGWLSPKQISDHMRYIQKNPLKK